MGAAYHYYLLSGIELDFDSFDLGYGVSLSRTFVHLMGHPVLAFLPAKEGKPSPAPWRQVVANSEAVAVDLLAELAIPESSDASDPTLHIDWASWITLLLRFLTRNAVTITLVSPVDTRGLRDGTAKATLSERIPAVSERSNISAATADWLKQNWYRSFGLSYNDAVLYAVSSLYHSHRSRSELGMVSVWAGLERIFSTKDAELKYRVCTNLASFLEPPGESRYLLFKHLSRLYDDRSKAAHGSPMKNPSAYEESATIASRALLRIVEINSVPNKDDFERELLAPVRRSNNSERGLR
ncbi:MAG: hypothetical protein WBE76_10595 [Terracidiphilus sp.]